MSPGLDVNAFSSSDKASQAACAASTSVVTIACASALVLETPLFHAIQCLDSTQSVATHTLPGLPLIQNLRLSSCVMKPFPVFVATQ